MTRLYAVSSLFLLLFLASVVSAQEMSPERKAYVVRNLEKELFRLPYELDYIMNTIVPETQLKRQELAPHYPDMATLERNQAIIDQAFVDWVNNYTSEYQAYHTYLRTYIATHKS